MTCALCGESIFPEKLDGQTVGWIHLWPREHEARPMKEA